MTPSLPVEPGAAGSRRRSDRRSDRARRDRLTRIERRLVSAEYLLDSTNTHVRRVGCDDVKPIALTRYRRALNDLRAAIAMFRNETGVRHLTLFAGSAAPQDTKVPPADWKTRKQKQKAWGTSRPHRWKKDCD